MHSKPASTGISGEISLPAWNLYVNRMIASEISTMTRYYDRAIHLLPRKDDKGILFESLDCRKKEIARTWEQFQSIAQASTGRDAYVLNGNLNHHFDIQEFLTQLKSHLNRESRVVIVAYNPYLSGLYRLANWLGIREGEQPSTFLTTADLENICQLSGFRTVRIRPMMYFPFRLFGIGNLINRILPILPFFKWFGLASIITLRPEIRSQNRPSLSIIIPARNEKGNIENALKRLPDLGCETEIVFIEGHSSDGTWEEIQRVAKSYEGRFKIQTAQQSGKGKGDAVRLGFEMASCDLLTILDADLTMPPELLGRFYEAYAQGLGDFINGSRLLYPMEGGAMRFLNRLGNIFFAKALSFVLDNRLTDSLCGTKLVSKKDYQRMVAWRKDFGDFDPFGDFELLFPAALLGLGIENVPIRYRARTYGTTNISRFRHGFMLLKMTLIGLFRIKSGFAPKT